MAEAVRKLMRKDCIPKYHDESSAFPVLLYSNQSALLRSSDLLDALSLA
jgi:hypothetical protein